MAKIQLNSILRELRGSLGDLVIRHTPHGQVVSRKPDMSRVQWSSSQIAHRERMKSAAIEYRKVMSNPVQAARHSARAAKLGIPVSSLIMGEFLRTRSAAVAPTTRGQPRARSGKIDE